MMSAMPDEPLTLRQRLAGNVRYLRNERGWSQEDLAAKSGLHHNQISRIERTQHSVGLDIIEKLALAFGVPARDLLD